MSMNNIKTDQVGAEKEELPSGCIRIFGLPFFVIGIGLLIWGISMVKVWHDSDQWPKAQARILSAEIKTYSGSKGASTYNVVATYEYTYDSQKYTGTKVTIEDGASSNYSAYQEQLNVLQNARRNNQTVDVFVNPSDHSDSFIFREISTGMIVVTGVGLVFALLGGAMLFNFVSVGGGGVDKKKLKQFPEKPWLADPRWSGFNIKTNNRKKLFGLYGVAFFFTAFISIFFIVMIMDKSTPFFAYAVVSIFALIAVIIDCIAVYSTLQYMKFGDSTLILSQFPLSPGREFTAVLAVKARFEAGQNFNFELICERKKITGSGKNAQTHTETIFKASRVVKANPENFRNQHIFVPVKFEIKSDAPTVTPENFNPSLTWKIKAAASVPGVDYGDEFALPVYPVSDEKLIEYKS